MLYIRQLFFIFEIYREFFQQIPNRHKVYMHP